MRTTQKTKEQLVLEIKHLKSRLEEAGKSKGIDQLQDLVDNTSEIITLLSLSGRFLFTNKAFLEVVGYTSEELTTLKLEDLLHERFKEQILGLLEEIKKGSSMHDVQVVLRGKSNRSVYLSGDINCRFENGKPTAFRCLLRDITQRRQAENAQNLYYSIAQSNLNTPNLYDFLRQVQVELQKNIYANNFFVAIYEPEDGEIFFPYHVDEKYKMSETQIRRKMGKGVVEYSIVKNTPLFLQKADLELLVKSNEVFYYGPVLPAVMVIVPLIVEGKTMGVIGIKSYSDANKFTNKDLELLQFVSGQVALALNRRKYEIDIMRQTARLNAIFDSSSHLIWTVKSNKKRQLSSFNKNYSDLIYNNLGVPPQINVSTEKIGWLLINPEDRPILREKYNRAFDGEPQYFEMNWGEKDGGTDWYEFYLNPILSATDGSIEEVCGIARNVTDKRNSLMRIQKSEEKFRNIIESFIDIYYRTDLNGVVTMISPSVETHTGYNLKDVLGKKVDQFFVDATGSSRNIKSILKNGNVTNFEVNVKRKDKELRQFMLNIRMIRNERGLPIEIEGIARDITELRTYAEELKHAKEGAEQSLKIKEQFLANMSHEIRTPMNGIIGMIDVLNQTPLAEEQKDYVETIKKSSETLLVILNDILDLSKIEAGKMELSIAPMDLHEVMNRLTALFKQRAIDKKNKLVAMVEQEVPRFIMGDDTRLLQILSNLTSNALKFTDNGKVSVSVSNLDDEILFEVNDSGIGISEENQKLLFNAFQQIDNSTKKAFGGTGLGLAISKELCRRMNGRMGVRSKPNEGSTFWFTIESKPTTQQVAAESVDEEKLFASYFEPSDSPHILLVDDNAINRKVASEILLKANCKVTIVSSGREAIELKPVKSKFDIILMDIQMPDLDGMETTKFLRANHDGDMPIVVAMTAYSMQNDKERFLNNGMDSYIPKPIRAQSLLQKIYELYSSLDKSSVTSNFISDDEETVKVEEKLIEYSIPKFDFEVINSLKEMVGSEVLKTVFDDFEVESREQLENTLFGFKDGDINIIQRELHTLKGNSGTIGLMMIHEATKLIEEPAKTGDLSNFMDRYKALVQEFDYFVTNKEKLYAD
ncbi:MAG: PAS domain S-box-containing protein [Spirosomataceae bacterium]|jgi:PAS domain S-box-containing protein